MASLPSVPDFAECFLSGTRQRGYLPSAREKALGKHPALGKEVVCRVPRTRRTITLGKTSICRVLCSWHSAKAAAVNGRQPPLTLCRVSSPDTRQSDDLPSIIFWHSAKRLFAECHFLTLGKPYFFTFYIQTFSAVLIQYLVLMFQCGAFLGLFSLFL